MVLSPRPPEQSNEEAPQPQETKPANPPKEKWKVVISSREQLAKNLNALDADNWFVWKIYDYEARHFTIVATRKKESAISKELKAINKNLSTLNEAANLAAETEVIKDNHIFSSANDCCIWCGVYAKDSDAIAPCSKRP